jgi:hypothetical protein
MVLYYSKIMRIFYVSIKVYNIFGSEEDDVIKGYYDSLFRHSVSLIWVPSAYHWDNYYGA